MDNASDVTRIKSLQGHVAVTANQCESVVVQAWQDLIPCALARLGPHALLTQLEPLLMDYIESHSEVYSAATRQHQRDCCAGGMAVHAANQKVASSACDNALAAGGRLHQDTAQTRIVSFHADHLVVVGVFLCGCLVAPVKIPFMNTLASLRGRPSLPRWIVTRKASRPAKPKPKPLPPVLLSAAGSRTTGTALPPLPSLQTPLATIQLRVQGDLGPSRAAASEPVLQGTEERRAGIRTAWLMPGGRSLQASIRR